MANASNRKPAYPDIPVPTDLPSALEAIMALKQAVEALTGSTSQVGGRQVATSPADSGAVTRVWVTRQDNPGAPPPVGVVEGDMWFLVPGSDPAATWILLVWYRGAWTPMTPLP